MPTTILVVDDNTELRKIYRAALEKAGFSVVEAVNGAAALEQLNQQTFPLMIVDMLMPAFSGEMLVKRLQDKPEHKDMKIIVSTAYPSFGNNMKELPVAAFLVKPVQISELLEKVREVLATIPEKTTTTPNLDPVVIEPETPPDSPEG